MPTGRTFKGSMIQGRNPEWGPLLALVGEASAGEFKWMFEAELSDGTNVQAYKHVDTRGYLHLDAGGRAYVYRDPDRYELVPAAELLRRVLPWPGV